MVEYPDAKVILTVRDVDSWMKSWNALNREVLDSITFKFFSKIPGTSFYIQKKIHNEAILGPRGMFKGHKSEENIKNEFTKWNQSVIDYVPKDRLLVYEIKDGWEPLCNFLNMPVPDISFFHKNKTKNMGHMSRFINSMFVLLIIIVTAIIISSVFWGVKYFG